MQKRTKDITQETIESRVVRIPEAGCLIWMGATQVRGYGEITSNNKKHLAHRASYETFVGPIPEGMYVCHSCDNVYCVNPNHLFLGTQKQNLQDMARKGRSTRGSKNPRAKLNEGHVKEIKRLIDGGCSLSIIAKDFNVTSACIYSIKKGSHWKHV